MSIKINAQLEKLKAIGKIVRKTLDEMTAAVLSGMTTGGKLKSAVVNVKVTNVIVLCGRAAQ